MYIYLSKQKSLGLGLGLHRETALSSLKIHMNLPSKTDSYYTSIKIIKNEVGCRDDTVPKTVGTRRHCEEE